MWRLDFAGHAVFSRQEPPSSPQELRLPDVASCPWGPPPPPPGQGSSEESDSFPRCLFMPFGKSLVNSHPVVVCLTQARALV